MHKTVIHLGGVVSRPTICPSSTLGSVVQKAVQPIRHKPKLYETTNTTDDQIIDNSGGIIAECIRVAKVKTRHGSSGFAGVGDEIGVVINKARPISLTPTTGPGSVGAGSSNIQKVRKGDIRRAVVVRTRKEERREDGRYVK